MPQDAKRRPGGIRDDAAADDLVRINAANDSPDSTYSSIALSAHAEARLDILLAALVDDHEAQQALEAIFERVTLPLVERIAAKVAGEDGP